MERRHVVVVGGGLAGLSAALACVDGGARVTLVESRPRFGGATWSFERNGLHFDNGQHVYLRCCSAYQRFLERIGSIHDAPIQDRLEIPVLRPVSGKGPQVSWLKRSSLPAPLHLAPSLLRYRHLSLRDRLGLGRAALALMRLRLEDHGLDGETFGSFLRRHGQSTAAIERIWDLIALPTINVHADEASLLVAAKVFQTGLFSESDAGDIGWARVPLNRLHSEPAIQLLRRAGAEVRSRAKAEAIRVEQGSDRHAASIVVEGSDIPADAIIVAVPHESAASLLPSGAIEHQGELSELGWSPIVDVHLVYDRVVSDYAMAAGVGTPVQFVFDRSVAAGMPAGEGQCLALSISGADAEHGERPESLIDRYSAAIVELFPKARDAVLVDAVVSREHHATFRARPGQQRLRAPSTTGLDNVFLAGAWTDTGWPTTMEGAVRSGTRAAGLALGLFGSSRYLPQFPEEVVA